MAIDIAIYVAQIVFTILGRVCILRDSRFNDLEIRKRMSSQLKRAGINNIYLIRIIYVYVIIPVVKYACLAWHTNLPKYISDNTEIIKKMSLKTRFPGFAYEIILHILNLLTLHQRKNELCRAYFAQMKRSDHKLNAVLPNGRSVLHLLTYFKKFQNG